MARRAITSALTMLALIGLLVLGAVWGWNSLFAPLPEDVVGAEEPAPTCDTQRVAAGERLRTDQVQVSVFNGGSRSGLAGQTLDALVERGFLPGDIGNAPSDLEVRKVQVWSTVKDDPMARLVARQFGRSVKVRFSDEDLGPGVDVVVGDRYRNLSRAPRTIRVEEPLEFCVSMLPSDVAG
ncbi:MAG TPA: LytR C-terminal domain-containing protein [Nocardioidaceae bacterium]|nr:LytR C-terminal domain-containing protein [Nocardioidaceae bacterium]